MLLWQDTFLSFTYDRPPSNINYTCTIPQSHEPDTGYTFAEAIWTLCHALLDRARNESAERLDQPMVYLDRVNSIWDNLSPHLTSKTDCRTLQDHLERLAVHVHISYASSRLSRLIRDSVSQSSPTEAPKNIAFLYNSCLRNAADAIECFLEMHRLSDTVCRAWAFVHNAVSCALTIKFSKPNIPGQSYGNLVERLVSVLELEERKSSWEDGDSNVRQFGPYSRALRALKDTSDEV